MKQFDVYANPVQRMASSAPYVVVLSSDLIDLPAVLMAPLIVHPTRVINGVDVPVSFEGQDLIVALLIMANVGRDRLRKPLGSLASYEFDLRRGLDRLFTGF